MSSLYTQDGSGVVEICKPLALFLTFTSMYVREPFLAVFASFFERLYHCWSYEIPAQYVKYHKLKDKSWVRDIRETFQFGWSSQEVNSIMRG